MQPDVVAPDALRRNQLRPPWEFQPAAVTVLDNARWS